MSVGPVQLLVLAYRGGEVPIAVTEELERLTESDAVRLLDTLVVVRDDDGALHLGATRDDTPDIPPGNLLLQLLDGTADVSHLAGVSDADVWRAADAIPRGSVTALALIEHTWAGALQAAVASTEEAIVADAWLAPTDVASLGL